MPDNIIFSSDPAIGLKSFLDQKKYSRLMVLTDENTLRLCYPMIKKAVPPHEVITVKSGEEYKSLGTCIKIWDDMTNYSLDRHSLLIILGGGVLGDMGGFCAATFKRGIDFVLIPTTLLAQVDASVGGKLGVDFNHYKNHIGVFQVPVLTVVYHGFLQTLPEPELRSGFAEIIKHILISDAELWQEIKTLPLKSQHWEKLITHSIAFKTRVVNEDPREKGLRKILNAGHTIGHAIETHLLSQGRKIMHGEAIAVGLLAEGFIARHRGLLPQYDLDEMTAFILKNFGKVDFEVKEDEAISGLTLQDKKNKGNKVLCVLLEGIGKPFLTSAC
jgi:3-dehydroquinate synthase